ncbi:MAG: hypothetical protein JOZ54_11620 [Acidobacteria bacterium]|nr:hypothetical protein [Acidobacteriota bacterium]
MRQFVVSAIAAVSLLVASAAMAQDVVTVGTVNATGSTVDVPVSIRDASGTPLGMDQTPPARIQAFSIHVNYSPADAVSSVTFSRAGITANLSPTFETKPASLGSTSLLVSFQQSSNPIPFSLNAGAPGNLVAHLVFHLSASATPGTDITLSLDGATTQLTDEGGSAATKETNGNGRLALVGGAIHIPVPTLSLTPANQSIGTAGSGSLSVRTSSNLVNDTTVALTSSNPAVATVPAAAVIAAGTQSITVTVSPRSVGTTTITATLPASAGGATATAIVTVTQSTIPCTTPAAPLVDAPSSALVGAAYTVSWTAVNAATEYTIEEATDEAFATATSRTTTATSATYTHDVADARYYYRVRARNRAGACDVLSAASTSISVAITALPPPARRALVVVGSTPGSFGSYFKTSLQLFNPKTVTVSGKLVFHTQAVSGTATDPSMPYSIAPGKTIAFADLLPAMNIATGLGSVDLVADTDSPFPVALARVFNDAGAAGTTGLTLEALEPEDALLPGDTAAVLVPADVTRFRLNIGVRTLERGAAFTVTVRDRDGAVVRTVAKTLPATYFRQVGSAELLDGLALTGGESLTIAVTDGAVFVYGATTDNITNDPSVQLARRIE